MKMLSLKLSLLMVLASLTILVKSHSYPMYKFDYGVKDLHTGDVKRQWETRHGDQVKGAYELNEADGTKRVVEYTADKHSGFNAVVKRVGHPAHHGHGHHGHHGNLNSYSNYYSH